ncbi:MAG TPA: endonuclease/exonuclease/phosphatase family protein [Thermoanaerobaculia bacterium]|nr:endonuclease/exonuclease/phosphatase family protein [Thermoanaerobaculia bacterium]
MSTPLRPRSIAALTLVTVALLMAATLWSLGAIAPMRPFALRALLLGSSGLALIAWPLGWPRQLGRPVRIAVTLGAVVSLISSVLLVVVLVVAPPRMTTGGWDRTESAAPQRLRVVSFNVLHGYPRLQAQAERADRLASALDSLDADVLLLQEAWCLAGSPCLHLRLAERLGMGWAWTAANGSPLIGFEEGCAILSRYPLVDVERWDLRPRARPWRRRVALVARVELGDRPLRLVCTHLANDAPAVAASQAADLARRLGDARGVLLGGDLNLDGRSDGVRRLVESGLVDLLPDGIDHVLLDPDSRWSVAGVEKQLDPATPGALSDHPALVVDLLRADDAASSGQ